MEDDLNYIKMEDDLNFFQNGRRPQLFQKCKTTSIFSKLEYNFKFLKTEEDLILFKRLWFDLLATLEDDLNFFKMEDNITAETYFRIG